MKSISIITFHYAHNYGAMLQVYALCTKLNKYGYNVKILDYRNPHIEKQYKIVKFYGKNPIKLFKQLLEIIKGYSLNKTRYLEFDKFLNEKLVCSPKRFYNVNDINVNSDIYITGSDQVWNPNIVGEISDAYTLNFGDENIKRVSYAASIGNSNIEEKYKEDYKNKLSKLDFISVREEDAQKALLEIVDKPIEVVLDPTLLLTKEDWNNEIEACSKVQEKYILAYVVEADEEYKKIVNDLSKKTGLKVIHFEKRNKYDNVLRSAYTDGPLEFVNLIKNAEYVVATSFHATVFSIIFNKKFFIVPHKKTGSRVINLLDKLEITGRTFNNFEEFKNIDYNFETDWDSVEKKLEEEREKSINWLKNAIEG